MSYTRRCLMPDSSSGLPYWHQPCAFPSASRTRAACARSVLTRRDAPGRFLFSATVELFERYGFSRGRQVGKHAWIVSKVVDPA